MRNKKNPKVNLEKKRWMFFPIGLIFAILVSLFAFEWKSYVDTTWDGQDTKIIVIEDSQQFPLTFRKKKKLPPPPKEIKIVPNEIELKIELNIDDTDSDEDEPIEIDHDEDEDAEDIPILIVEDKPIFPGCEDVSKEERYICFQSGIMKYISSNFKYPVIPKEMGISEKIIVQFVIDKTGNITKATEVRGEDKHLKQEALRLVNSIPKLQAAKQRGKPVPCSFTVPINFKLQ